MRFTFTQHADEHERFAPGCFDGQIGQFVPVTAEDAPYGRGRLVSAKVAEDGRSVELTVDTMPPMPESLARDLRMGGDGGSGLPAPEGFRPLS